MINHKPIIVLAIVVKMLSIFRSISYLITETNFRSNPFQQPARIFDSDLKIFSCKFLIHNRLIGLMVLGDYFKPPRDRELIFLIDCLESRFYGFL